MKTPKCLNCLKRKAFKDPLYGWTVCKVCQKAKANKKLTYEITTEAIKDERLKYSNDIIQPYRDGELSKEYVDAYPDRVQKMLEEKNITYKEVEKAKNVWPELDYYKKE